MCGPIQFAKRKSQQFKQLSTRMIEDVTQPDMYVMDY